MMQRVGLIVPHDFELSSLTPLSVLEAANAVLGEPRYAMRILTEEGGCVPGSFGMQVVTHPIGDMDFDTLLVGGASAIVGSTSKMRGFLRRAAKAVRRIASIRLGAFCLAEAGLLDGRRATTHWAFVADLQQRFPRAKVETDRIFTEDGPIWTSAGMTAGNDLALALIERDLGRGAMREVARQLVVESLRPGAQSQHSASLELDAKSDRVAMALAHARQNLRTRLSVEELADAARLSPRQFTRVFSAETGCSPARAVEQLRIEAARLLINLGRLPIDTIADEAGFGDRERMRRAFQRAFGKPPLALRQISDARSAV